MSLYSSICIFICSHVVHFCLLTIYVCEALNLQTGYSKPMHGGTVDKYPKRQRQSATLVDPHLSPSAKLCIWNLECSWNGHLMCKNVELNFNFNLLKRLTNLIDCYHGEIYKPPSHAFIRNQNLKYRHEERNVSILITMGSICQFLKNFSKHWV